MNTIELVEAVRSACLRTATAAYEDAGIQGLCAEGRWEAAVSAIQSLDLCELVKEHEGSSTSPA